MITQDEYQTVTNSQGTYKGLDEILSQDRGNIQASPVIFAWTDGASTQLDILMVNGNRSIQYGILQRGMKARTDLFVAVSGFGMFGFAINDLVKYPAYVGEKLGISGINETTEKLAELINGVIGELLKNEQ
jgi:hypothetical protein